jgi:uncharacterized membrane protein
VVDDIERGPRGIGSADDAFRGPMVPRLALASSRNVPAVCVLELVGLDEAHQLGALLTGWPPIIAVNLNYVKRSDARGSWLESHFRWQIRTFWFGLLWVVLCGLLVVLTLGVGLIIVWLPLAFVTTWFIYRIARGWPRLGARQRMYA